MPSSRRSPADPAGARFRALFAEGSHFAPLRPARAATGSRLGGPAPRAVARALAGLGRKAEGYAYVLTLDGALFGPSGNPSVSLLGREGEGSRVDWLLVPHGPLRGALPRGAVGLAAGRPREDSDAMYSLPELGSHGSKLGGRPGLVQGELRSPFRERIARGRLGFVFQLDEADLGRRHPLGERLLMGGILYVYARVLPRDGRIDWRRAVLFSQQT